MTRNSFGGIGHYRCKVG